MSLNFRQLRGKGTYRSALVLPGEGRRAFLIPSNSHGGLGSGAAPKVESATMTSREARQSPRKTVGDPRSTEHRDGDTRCGRGIRRRARHIRHEGPRSVGKEQRVVGDALVIEEGGGCPRSGAAGEGGGCAATGEGGRYVVVVEGRGKCHTAVGEGEHGGRSGVTIGEGGGRDRAVEGRVAADRGCECEGKGHGVGETRCRWGKRGRPRG